MDADWALFDSEPRISKKSFQKVFTLASLSQEDEGRERGRKVNTISHSIMDLEWVSWSIGSRLLFNTPRTMSLFQERRKEEVKPLTVFPIKQHFCYRIHFRRNCCSEVLYYNKCAACYSTSSEVK